MSRSIVWGMFLVLFFAPLYALVGTVVWQLAGPWTLLMIPLFLVAAWGEFNRKEEAV